MIAGVTDNYSKIRLFGRLEKSYPKHVEIFLWLQQDAGSKEGPTY